MGEVITHRGYTIELASGQVSDPDGWVARAELTQTDTEPGQEVQTARVADPQFTRFATKEQADELALRIARAWVDQRSSA